MIVNTRRLFCKLLPLLEIDTVCDVGSLDGADALRFRAAAPNARIYAFEANPRNLAAMHSSRTLRASEIQTVPMAVTDFDGEADFFAVEAGAYPGDDWRGMSSLHRRTATRNTSAAMRVKTCRLDSFLSSVPGTSARLGLWIDTEGKGYEVLDGVEGRIACVQLVHVEVETKPCIAPMQKLYADIRTLLLSKGFEELASDRRRGAPQFNVLFVRQPPSARARFAILLDAAVEGMRAAFAAAVHRVCPAWPRRTRAGKLHAR